MTTRVGTIVGRYEIDAELGRGAMGVVFRARDPKIDRTVAIKTISLLGLEPEAEQEYRERLVVEARAAGRLSHSGIVSIFDIGEEPESGAPYLVMEYVEGQSLDKLLSRKNNRLPLGTTLRLSQELAEALHYAHEQGVIHRDIKPSNILVTQDGHAKIADFGIAKLNQAQLTMPGQVLGSPAYMAPEQLSDEGVDGRSDLFSVGVILYSMLTGHRPFQGNSATTVCFKLVNHDPLAVTTFDSKFPPDIDRIVSRAIAKNPTERYQTGMELADDIKQLRETCGLLQKADWTARSLKTDAIPRYVAGISGQSLAHKSGTEDARAERLGRSWMKWNGLVPSALLAIAIGFVTFYTIHRVQPPASSPKKMEPIVEAPTTSVDKSSGNNKINSVSRVPARGTLQIEIQHHFSDGQASVWLDERLIYTHSLRGNTKTRALVFRKVEGRQSETIGVPTGKHKLRVEVQSAAGHYDQSRSIDGAFIRNRQSTLDIVCGKKRDELQVVLQ